MKIGDIYYRVIRNANGDLTISQEPITQETLNRMKSTTIKAIERHRTIWYAHHPKVTAPINKV